METKVIHRMETIGKKTYPITVTKQVGLQEIEDYGKKILVEAVTITESPLGTTVCYSRARPEVSEEERAANRRRIIEVATQAMIDQGIW